MVDVAEDMGMLKKAVDTLETDSKQHFESNEHRKKENYDIKLQNKTIQHTVEETNTIVNGVAGAVEEIKASLIEIAKAQIRTDATVNENQKSTDIRFKHLEDQIKTSTEKQFDWKKFMVGLDDMIKMKMFWATIIFLSLLIFVWNRPELAPLLSDIFYSVGGKE